MKKYFISILLCIMIGGSLSVVFNLLVTSNVYINCAVIGAVCGFFSHYTVYYYKNKEEQLWKIL